MFDGGRIREAKAGGDGAVVLGTRGNGSARVSTFVISPAGHAVKRLYALPHPIPVHRGLFLESA